MNTGIKFSCHGKKCLESCCGAFSGFSDKLTSIDEKSFQDIILTHNDAIKINESGYANYIFIGDDGLWRIKTDMYGVCSAFDSGKCLINDFKPTICKCFPLYLDAFVGLCYFKECPATEGVQTLKNFVNEIYPLLDMYEFWISYYKTLLNHKTESPTEI